MVDLSGKALGKRAIESELLRRRRQRSGARHRSEKQVSVGSRRHGDDGLEAEPARKQPCLEAEHWAGARACVETQGVESVALDRAPSNRFWTAACLINSGP